MSASLLMFANAMNATPSCQLMWTVHVRIGCGTVRPWCMRTIDHVMHEPVLESHIACAQHSLITATMVLAHRCYKGDACAFKAPEAQCRLQRCRGAALYKELHAISVLPDVEQTPQQKLVLGPASNRARQEQSICEHAAEHTGGERYFHQQCLETGVGKRGAELVHVTSVTRKSDDNSQADCTHTRQLQDIRHFLCECCHRKVAPRDQPTSLCAGLSFVRYLAFY